MWKSVDATTQGKLLGMLKEIWRTEHVPEDWKTALIHPIFKKGDKTDANNYRGISLLPVTYKILSKALQNRLEEQLDKEIGEYQGGFRKGRSCVEQILNLKFVIRYRRLRGKDIFITFVDFKKAYDSADRSTLFNILKEFGADNKTTAIVKETLSETFSKVKFRGEVSRPFKIRTGLRQGDGLSPLLFNCILEKVIREWRKRMDEENIQKIRLGRKRDNLEVDCLAFADDLAILAENLEDATKQINILKETAEKARLQISFEKTEYLTNVREAPNHMHTKYGQIKKVPKFKYLGEIIEPNALDKEGNKARMRKMETAFHLTKDVYNKKSLSINAKIRHYNTVIKPECLYASECLTMNTKKDMENITKKERKIIRRVLGPRYENGIWKLRSNKEVYEKVEKIGDTMRKRRVSFYAHLKRMRDDRLTKRIFKFFDNNPRTQVTWFKEVKSDIVKMGIGEEDLRNRELLRAKIKQFKGFEAERRRTGGAVWTEERKEEHRERMKIYWQKRKEEERNRRNIRH
ncbi:hypothetical protein M8J77_000221 [Diaphorina citri]|nr:hypothetical protein M8J77_000221 [Diaphorina citri]